MSLKDYFSNQINQIKEPFEDISSLQTDIWEQNLKRYKFSDFLPYMSYDDKEKYYINNDNSYGAIFICSPRIMMGDTTATTIEEILSKLPDDMFIQFTLFGLKNINQKLEYYRSIHKQRAYKENNTLLHKAVDEMTEFYYTKTKESPSTTMTSYLKDYYLLISLKSDKKDDILTFKLTLRNILSSNKFSPQPLEPSFLKPMLWEIFNPNHNLRDIPRYDEYCYLNRQLIHADTAICIHDDYMECDKKTYISLIPQSFPNSANLSEFGEKLGDNISRTLDTNQFKDTFFITCSAMRLPKKRAKQVSKNHTIILSQKFSETFFRKFAAVREESVELLDRIDLRKESLYAFDMNVIISGENYEEAEKNARSIISYWNKGGEHKALILCEALGIHQLNFIASLPMGINKEYVFDITAKYRSMFSDQISQFIPLEADYKGVEPNIILFSRRAQIAGLDLFSSNTNYNAYLVATSGAGKSVLLNMLAFNSYARGDRVFIIDQDNSFLKLCETIDGQYVALDPLKPMSFNPFSDIQNEAQLIEELEYLSALIYMLGSSKNESESKKHEKLVKNALQDLLRELFKEKGNALEITDIKEAFIKSEDIRFKDFANQLGTFCKGGIYEKFLSGKCEFNIKKEFIVSEFKGLEGHDDLRDPLIMLLIYHINQLMYMSPDRNSKIQIIVDEAHRFLGKNPKMDDFIEQLYRRARKYGGSAILATQGFDDIYNAKEGGLSRAGITIVNNSAWKIFMKQTETSVNMLLKSEVFDLNEIDKEMLRSISITKGEYSEAFIMTPEDVKLPYRLVMDRYFYYLTTTDPKDKAKIKELTDSGLSLEEAISQLIQREKQ